MTATLLTELDKLNAIADHVAIAAKQGTPLAVRDCKTLLSRLIADNNGQAFPVAPNVYAFLFESVEKCEAIRFPQPVVQQVEVAAGTYTIEMDGGHFTFRVKTAERGTLAGKTIVEAMVGSDNENDFIGVGFLNADGTVKAWKKFTGSEKWMAKIGAISAAFAGGGSEEAGKRYALVSGRCRRCNRKLTVPASIHAGYGPECVTKV